MGVEILTSNFKFFSQLKNGSDFSLNTGDYTLNLVGSIGDRVKVTFDLAIRTFLEATPSQVFNVSATSTRLTRTFGSWIDDGFSVGDTFNFYNASLGTDACTITSINDTTIIYTGGSLITDGDYSGDPSACSVFITTPLTALIYKYGIIENSDFFSSLSNVTENDQSLYATQIGYDTGGGVRDTGWHNFTKQGNYKDWYFSDSDVKRVKWVSTDGSYYSTQHFSIEHEFIITPFYLENWADALTNGLIPDELNGLLSLKYSFGIEFRSVLSNPNTGKTANFDTQKGCVAYFDENFNGFLNNYSIDSVTYYDGAEDEERTAIDATSATIVKILIDGTFSAGNSKANLIVFSCADESLYKNKYTTLQDNFHFDNKVITEGASASSSTIINDCECNIVGSQLEVKALIDLESLDLSNITNYVIAVQVEDYILTNATTDKVTLLADYNEYTFSAVNAFIYVDDYYILEHPETYGISSGCTSLSVFNEDGFLHYFKLKVLKEFNPIINWLQFDIIAYKDNSNYFSLGSFEIPITDIVLNTDLIQQINIDSERNFPLNDSDLFKTIQLSNFGETLTTNDYELLLGNKINWKEWIYNALVDNDFYDATEPNNNKNFKSSNYDTLHGYDVRPMLSINATGLNQNGNEQTSTFKFLLPEFSRGVFDYDEGEDWTATVETFSEDGLVNYGGVIRTDKNTLFKITWVKAGLFSPGYNFWSIHRIEIENNQSDEIYELSSVVTPMDNNILIPITGETLLKIDVDEPTSTIITQCLIDYTKLEKNKSYKLSAVLKDGQFTGYERRMVFEDDDIMTFEDGTIMTYE